MEKLPSVTRVVSLLSSKHLLEWSNKLGLNGVILEEYLEERSSVGELVHTMILDYIEGNDTVLKAYNQYAIDEANRIFNRFLDFWNTYKLNPLLVEEKIYTDKYCGIIDLYATSANKHILIDFKTGFLKLTHKIQVSAYKKLLEDNGLKVDEVYILSLTLKSDSYIFARIYDTDKYYACFMHLLEVYNLLKGEFEEIENII